MIVCIDDEIIFSIKDQNNFGKLHVEIGEGLRNSVEDGQKVAGLDFSGASEIWLPAARLRQLPAVAGDTEWQSGFDRMVEAARPHGWIADDPECGTSIRAHVVWVGTAGSHSNAAVE